MLLLSQKNGHTKQLPEQSQDRCLPAALLWLLLLIMHKFLELSRGYGYSDVLVSFCWHLLNFRRTCLPQMVSSSSDSKLCPYYYYCSMTTNRKPQGKWHSSSHRTQRIILCNVYLCNTHNFMCDQRAGECSPTSVATCNQQKP